MSRWEIEKGLWPFLDKLEKLKLFGTNRDEVVNTLLSMQIVSLIESGVISTKVPKPRRWFHRLKRR
jgi:hypothetical protein